MVDRIKVELVSYTSDGERLVASSSKVSLSRKPVKDIFSIDEPEVTEWIIETYRRQHFSPWEHSVYTFVVDGLSRVASHQLVRHRIASYTQQSHRYTEGYLRYLALEACKLTMKDCTEPESKKDRYDLYRSAIAELTLKGEYPYDERVRIASIGFVFPPTLDMDRRYEVSIVYLDSVYRYYTLLYYGARREDARYILPSAVRTRIVVTMNARELVQSFLPLRMCTRAQWEIRRIAWLLWKELVKVHPRLFKWAGPSCVFKENTTRGVPRPLVNYLSGEEEFTIPRCPELVENKAIRGCLLTAYNESIGVNRSV